MGRNNQAVRVDIQDNFYQVFGREAEYGAAVGFDIADAAQVKIDFFHRSDRRGKDHHMDPPAFAALGIDVTGFGSQDKVDGRGLIPL